jgi:hypothetical protein
MRFLTIPTIGAAIALSHAANAQDWCGFRDRERALVRCGYSSLQQCRQALMRDRAAGKKDAEKPAKPDDDQAVICLPDPASG